MIVVVCLNPALDVTYHVDRLVAGSSMRVTAQRDRAGGKGVNVARVLHQLGQPARLVALAGGRRGEAIADELVSVGIDARWTPISAQTRRTVTIVDTEATVLRESGPECSAAEWSAFVADYTSALADADLVVLSGSLPDGVPADGYARLGAVAATRSVPVILDCAGAELEPALRTRPFLAKPNHEEAAAVWPGVDPIDAVLTAGAQNAVVSKGKAGLSASLDGRRFAVQVPGVVGNPTGAGDALTAGLAAGIAARSSWPDVLRDAVALAAGAVALPYAGGFDAVLADQLRPLITVEEL